MYFLVPRKCSIFGVHCEGIPRQVNYLTDESGNCVKGANVIVSQLHHFFETHDLGEMEVFLHADNCTVKNQNNCMVQYLAWRILNGRHSKITISFVVVGHTKFAPDWCFGLLKQNRRTKIGSRTGLAVVVNTSAVCKYSQLVTAEDGTTVLCTYYWTSFFVTLFRKITGIKKIHHFSFDSKCPGSVSMKEQCATSEEEISLLKSSWTPDPDQLPQVVQPKGLPRQKLVQQFCPSDEMDKTCPLPTAPKPTSRAGTTLAVSEPNTHTTITTPPTLTTPSTSNPPSIVWSLPTTRPQCQEMSFKTIVILNNTMLYICRILYF